jgi:sigma-B regulation protein RsbU (phosphoserine phosphatase)
MAYCVLWPDGRLMYSNAGHNPPMLFTHGRVRRLDAGGFPLGLFPDAAYEQETLRLEPGDVLVVFSDGVSETENASEDMFGDEGIIKAVSAVLDRDPQPLLEYLLAAADTFRNGVLPQDDVTSIVLRYRG